MQHCAMNITVNHAYLLAEFKFLVQLFFAVKNI